jgi:hypothetical protein
MRMRWAWPVPRVWGEDECVNDIDEKVRRKDANRNKYNIKINIRETGFSDMGWINLAQDTDQWLALLNMAMNFRVP